MTTKIRDDIKIHVVKEIQCTESVKVKVLIMYNGPFQHILLLCV